MSRQLLLLIVVFCFGCSNATEIVEESPPPAVSTDFARLPELLAGVQPAGRTALYEGLPSQFWEPQLRNQELLQKETLDVHGHAVYDDPQTPSAGDAEQLTALLAARDSYEPLSPAKGKKCGGFVAECCAEWTNGDKTTQILICLECGEAMLFSPQLELHCNLSPEAAQRLKQLLSPYQQNSAAAKPKS